MKHPLNEFHYVVRELICFTIGHNWKCSWRSKDNRDELIELDYRDISYRERMSGNPYCEYSASWSYKCRRCRESIRGDAWYPVWVYFRAAWSSIKSDIKWIFKEKEPLKFKVAIALAILPEAFFQFYYRLHEDHGVPYFPAGWAIELKWWIYDKFEDSNGTK